MQATKNRIANGLIFVVALAVLLTGCSPPGPRALLAGKRLLDEGKYTEAADKLKIAATLLSTNAQAWNYLGLACQYTGQITNAVASYQKALSLDRNLLEARFNLGCLWLDQNNLEAARSEFTAYTMRRANAPEGWIKLGYTQLRAREIANSERSFSEALRLSAQNPDALNGIGLAQLQRNRPREAAQYFAAALRQQPDHRAAMLNLARVLQVNLNDTAGALRCYQEYLGLTPKPADWDAVNAIAESLQEQLAAQQRTPPPEETPPPPTTTQIVKTQTAAVAKPVPQPKTETARPAPAPVVTQQQAQPTQPALSTQTPVEVVKVAPEPVIKTFPDLAPPAQTTPEVIVDNLPETPVTEQRQEKRGFFERINPLNLFRREPKPAPKVTPLPADDSPQQPRTVSIAPVQKSTAPPEAVQIPPTSAKLTSVQRYSYVSPRKPSSGNRDEAESAYSRGTREHGAGQLSDAAQSFSKAVKADPAYFEAQFYLALTLFELKQYRKSLAAWETALAIQPDSADARYNFALALKSANYPLDAANELEKILAANPDETRAHLALGNLYAEQLGDTARARAHYLRVLELSPSHPQGSAIRYWLVSHPQ